MYQIAYTRSAAKELQKIPRNVGDLIRQKLAHLANNPFLPNNNVRALRGRPGYRLRVGDWRIIYEIINDQMVIHVIKIAARGSVYE
jgi:mRNA interferase RelE/StbE